MDGEPMDRVEDVLLTGTGRASTGGVDRSVAGGVRRLASEFSTGLGAGGATAWSLMKRPAD